MFDENAEKSVKQAVCYELQNIVKEHGAVYNSSHEAYAVLREEADEVKEAEERLEAQMEQIWTNVKMNWKDNKRLFGAKETALQIALEAVQVAAVCERFIETLKGEE